MSDVKQVKVDNWGIYFLQRLKHFFNRTDYCDLTLQFQDNAQLKVHRLVLSACTEYFELLERTCEMYEDCLVMPDDLQADVVVPIVNFMYTGHLEFRMDLLERLYQTSQILNMPVLSKLLESHRNLAPKTTQSYSAIKRFPKQSESKSVKTPAPAPGTSNKRSYSKAFENNIVYRDKKTYQAVTKTGNVINSPYRAPSPISVDPLSSQKVVLGDPRPTRYEIPEELDTENVFDNSFSNISYASQPLMVHPDTVKRYKAKRSSVFGEGSSSKKVSGLSTVDIVEFKKIVPKEDSLFDDSIPDHSMSDENDLFNASYMDTSKDSNQLFDQILDNNDGPKLMIESKDNKATSNLDHARIISEVLKKYPHLVKSNKNIKLKILDPVPNKGKRQQKQAPIYVEEKPLKLKTEEEDFTYETDVIDSKLAAKLIAMGAENTKGPWICLICGTPGKALHFSSYYKFRRHLVDVHHEKPVSNICEYCGLRSLKRNYLLHHLYAQHGVEPPPQYHFPKCNMCSYIALTEGLLIKHKLTHKDIRSFRCNVCSSAFSSSSQLLIHIQNTGHKYSAEKKTNLQCIYCLKQFLRETNLYAHIKTHHKKEAKNDCIIEDSDDERVIDERPRAKGSTIKFEPSTSSYDNDYEDVDVQYQIQQRPIGDIQVVARKPHNVISNSKQKILNPGFGHPKPTQKAKSSKTINHNPPIHNEFFQDIKIPMTTNNQEDEIVVIDNNEYVMRDHQLIPRKRRSGNRDYILSDLVETSSLQSVQQPTTSVEYTNVQNTNIEENSQQQSSMILKKSTNINQPIQIVVSNEEEYKALMASNHPIIFDNGDANKTLAVLSAPHNSTLDTTAIDLDNTQTNEMMILPHEYPLNVTEAVPTENSNIVVVYSHPVDDQNKQFQILTTGGIGAQFVQSSAIITQNYETVTTSTPTMSAHCIEAQVEQTWQSNIQSLEGQQIQLPPDNLMQNLENTNQASIKALHNETDNNFDDLPEVHLIPEPQKPSEVSESNMSLNQSHVVNIEHVQQSIPNIENAHETIPQSASLPDILTETENVNVIEEPMETENIMEQSIQTENIMDQPIQVENVMEQPIQVENIMEQPIQVENLMEQPIQVDNIMEQPIQVDNIMEQSIQVENIIEQSIETENLLQQPLEIENIMEVPAVTGIAIEQQVQTESAIEEAVQADDVMEQLVVTNSVTEQAVEKDTVMDQTLETDAVAEQSLEKQNAMEQPLETVNVMEQPLETKNVMEQQLETSKELEQSGQVNHVMEQPIERENVIEETLEHKTLSFQTPPLQNNDNPEQEHSVDSATIIKFSEVTNNDDLNTEDQLPESQAYDDIVEISRVNDSEPIYAKQAEEKIQNLTSEWSEDEYDVTEEGSNKVIEKVTNENPQNQGSIKVVEPEFEESIENIQEEMKKQNIAAATAPVEREGETEESAISSQEEDSSSQDMHLPPLTESPVNIVEQDPQAHQKISSLLNDWEDNDSQEEMITVNENVIPPTPEETQIVTPHVAEAPADETSIGLTDKTKAPIDVPKSVKSLVSDWDDDDEENKE